MQRLHNNPRRLQRPPTPPHIKAVHNTARKAPSGGTLSYPHEDSDRLLRPHQVLPHLAWLEARQHLHACTCRQGQGRNKQSD